MTADVRVSCTCGPGVWATCDQCGADAWCSHHCGFPCDDVTCENGTVCTRCLTGRLCVVHNDDEWEDDEPVVTQRAASDAVVARTGLMTGKGSPDQVVSEANYSKSPGQGLLTAHD